MRTKHRTPFLLSYAGMITPSAQPTKPATPATPPAASLSVRVPAPDQYAAFDQLMAARHDRGAGQSVGDYLRQLVERDGQPAALLVWGPAG